MLDEYKFKDDIPLIANSAFYEGNEITYSMNTVFQSNIYNALINSFHNTKKKERKKVRKVDRNKRA